ncbi:MULTISPECIES: enoyl-CoA hydratase/isomerase family protein [Aquincola]|uniref:enoyl-CoA hydratase/isomerase family protein n=1 Tax=Aquincola TaxID=391952 RepID=UPI000614EB51|nr:MULTISPECIES: enoyl-CoA hydratase/isomerase family protein [Aquincola]MCR5869039.1 enoyl-CoA hydratase/isomerase family protein [Aquincola sp. J276]
MTGQVTLAREGRIATLTFDRPEARNAMTWAMYQQLAQHCRQLATERTARVVVMRGAGGEAFVAGTDISQFADFRTGDDGVAYERQIDDGIALIEALPMPTLAVIDGWAVGGGLAIANACDFRIASPKSRFGVPIARTLGNTLSIANLARLQAGWGLQRVRRMLVLAELINADEALACGWLQALCASEDLQAEAGKLCDRLLALAPVTQAVTKEGLRRINLAGLPQGDDLVRTCYGSADFQEGVQSFGEKRAAVWRGA